MRVIIGLGNPGMKYAGTRHNIGFDTVTALADKYNIKINNKKFNGLIGDGFIGGEKVLLVQPQTYMNLSGECVGQIADFFKIEPENLIVICDDINLDTGRLRIRAKGSAGGHNGLKNIIAHLGTEAFPRIRVGVGEKTEGWDLADYVLARFSKDDEPVMREAIKNAVGAVETWISDDIGTAMNRFNINPNPKPKKKPASETVQNSDNNPATDTKQVPANDPITECGQIPETDNPET
ncbi:MAG: aminoacyl-tRNA hydrolase [Lachnospiraceae bacterium]|nr:aminoacyl-tRNA hydrolase [Lachnospiraceae bacterium]